MSDESFQRFKELHLRALPKTVGVYALCDLDQVPIYIGQSTDGLRARIRRHLSSARSDLIANRQIDVWEIAFVWAWPVTSRRQIAPLETHLFARYNRQSELVNGKILTAHGPLAFPEPEKLCVPVMPPALVQTRKDPALRFPRQVQHFHQLVDYILNTQDKPHLRRALEVYYKRMTRYYRDFLGDQRRR